MLRSAAENEPLDPGIEKARSSDGPAMARHGGEGAGGMQSGIVIQVPNLADDGEEPFVSFIFNDAVRLSLTNILRVWAIGSHPMIYYGKPLADVFL